MFVVFIFDQSSLLIFSIFCVRLDMSGVFPAVLTSNSISLLTWGWSQDSIFSIAPSYLLLIKKCSRFSLVSSLLDSTFQSFGPWKLRMSRADSSHSTWKRTEPPTKNSIGYLQFKSIDKTWMSFNVFFYDCVGHACLDICLPWLVFSAGVPLC